MYGGGCRQRRRRIAEELRRLVAEAGPDGVMGSDVFNAFDVRATDVPFTRATVDADLLADLIDWPTCEDFGGEEGTNGECYDFACGRCGFAADIVEPRFCPNCGAEVLS